MILLCLGIFLNGCAGKQTKANLNLNEKTNARIEERLYGFWQAELPCADCPSIQYQLLLKADHTFEEASQYTGKSPKIFIETGNWRITQDTLLLLENADAVLKRFQITSDELIMLDLEGKRIQSAFAEMYHLRKKTEGGGESFLREKRERGVDFIATGNEPFWSLEIDLDKSISFKTLQDSTERNTPVPAPKTTGATGAISYHAKTEAGELTVNILNTSCTDNMSGELFPHTVEVKINNTSFSGCGRYLTDERLNANWVLQRLQGKEVEAAQFVKGLPTLAFQLIQGKVHGNAGCNRLNGTIEVKGDHITFSRLATTRMACPALSVEQSFLAILSDITLQYHTEASRLTISKNNEPVLVFRKVD